MSRNIEGISYGDPHADQAIPVALLTHDKVWGAARTFELLIAGRLTSAFVDWQGYIRETQSEETVGKLMQYARMMDFLLTHHNLVSVASLGEPNAIWSGNLNAFSPEYKGAMGLTNFRDDIRQVDPDLLLSQIIMEPGVIEPDEVETLFDTFGELCTHQPWELFRAETRIPFGAKLSRQVRGLPIEIRGGDLRWQFEFGRYYVPPHIRLPRYREQYFDYLAPHYFDEADMKIKTRVMRDLLGLIPNGPTTVLDVGCGPGLAQLLNERGDVSLFGVDESREMVRLATEVGEKCEQASIEKYHLDGREPFDVAMMSFLDFWLTDDDRVGVLRHLKGLVREGGKVIFNVHKPARGWKDNYQEILGELGYRNVAAMEKQIERTNGGVYTAYYVSAEV